MAVPNGGSPPQTRRSPLVRGPLAMAQILETSLLNQINFQTLIATKAARISETGRGQLMLEFGLRRGQDRGANAAARAALIGGADATSNVGISAVLGYKPSGTHAHSLVQLFMAMGMSELDAFRAFAEVYPDDCLLLVDTIDTLESGVPNAIKVFEELRRKGHRPEESLAGYPRPGVSQHPGFAAARRCPGIRTARFALQHLDEADHLADLTQSPKKRRATA